MLHADYLFVRISIYTDVERALMTLHNHTAGDARRAAESRSQNECNALGQLPEGSLEIIGDIHREIEALDLLLLHLGYRPDGTHPEGRRMVFLGDLIDREPDSPGVVHRVAGYVEQGRAMTVLGNTISTRWLASTKTRTRGSSGMLR